MVSSTRSYVRLPVSTYCSGSGSAAVCNVIPPDLFCLMVTSASLMIGNNFKKFVYFPVFLAPQLVCLLNQFANETSPHLRLLIKPCQSFLQGEVSFVSYNQPNFRHVPRRDNH